jgi:hypothetical protein
MAMSSGSVISKRSVLERIAPLMTLVLVAATPAASAAG